MAIDYEQGRLYWTDAQLDRIESVDFDGKNRLVVVSNVMHPYGITVYNSFVYWTDWQQKSVERADKLSGGHRQVIAENIDYLMEIKMVTPSRETGELAAIQLARMPSIHFRLFPFSFNSLFNSIFVGVGKTEDVC